MAVIILCTPLFPPSCQMDPKLRPSFPDIVKHLEEILARLKVDEMEHEGTPLSGDNDKKTTPNGNSKGVMQRFTTSASVSVKVHLHSMSKFLRKRKEGDQFTILLYALFASRPFIASSPLHTGSSCTLSQCSPVSVKPGGNFPSSPSALLLLQKHTLVPILSLQLQEYCLLCPHKEQGFIKADFDILLSQTVRLLEKFYPYLYCNIFILVSFHHC